MREPSPDSLITRLVELRLCTAAEVQRARGLVRRMTRDLPAFDSVWVDALTQLKVLTPFQSRWLENSPPESLVAGDHVLLDGLGGGTNSHTFLARGADRRPVVLKRLRPAAEQFDSVELRLQLLIERSRNVPSPQLAVPADLIRDGEYLFVASRHVPGLNLSELLIRRGRFPAQFVATIADQLLSALAAWHATGTAHGDLRLTKLRLTDRGQIVLVDCGVQSAIAPELLVHTIQSPDVADVVAPERIGTNQPATAASDLYAVGCVLWQLLAGRSPHPTADPLAKLAAHQTRRIPDVRELAPDTPARLAEVIHVLTSPNPLDRPQSAEAVRRRLGLRGKPRRAGLARFRRQFDGTVPHLATRPVNRVRRWQGITAATVLLGVTVIVLSDRGLRTEVLEIAQRAWSESPSSTKPTDAEQTKATSRLIEIPDADPHGVITLTKAGPYEIRELSAVGPLVIQAADGVRPRFSISTEPLRITAQTVSIQGIDLEWTGSATPLEPTSLLQLHTQRFQISDCRFSNPQPSTLDPRPLLAAIHWEPSDRRDPQAGVHEISDSQFSGPMHAVICRRPPRSMTWRNVLKTHAGTALVLEPDESNRGVKFVLQQVTLWEAGSLLSCAGPLAEQASASLIEIEAANSVFDVTKPSPLVELAGPKVRPDWSQAMFLTGDGCLVPPGAVLLAFTDSKDGTTSALESDELPFEGLFTDDYEFAGPLSATAAHSRLIRSAAPRRPGAALPGIDAGRLPDSRRDE